MRDSSDTLPSPPANIAHVEMLEQRLQATRYGQAHNRVNYAREV